MLDILELLKRIEPSSSKADIALKDTNLINVNDEVVITVENNSYLPSTFHSLGYAKR